MESQSCSDEHFQTPDSKPPSTVDYSESLSGDLVSPMGSANSVDESEVCECDLGLGRTKIDDDEAEERAEMHSDQYLLYSAKLPSNITKYGSFRKMLKLKKRNSCIESTNSSTEILDEDPASSPGATTGQNSGAIGSSLQQQKTICRKDVENVFIQKLLDEIQQDDSCFQSKVLQYIGDESSIGAGGRVGGGGVGGMGKQGDMMMLKRKFLDAVAEVERLKCDLSVRCQQLDSKHDAIQILQLQLDQANRAHKMEYDTCKNLDTNCKKLEKELEEVKWEFEVRDYQVGQSQEGWATRLQRLERENMQLHTALQRTQTELKCVQRENSVMRQEKQEMLCLMQMSSNERNLATSSTTESDTYHLTPQEMSVLGACNCNSSSLGTSSVVGGQTLGPGSIGAGAGIGLSGMDSIMGGFATQSNSQVHPCRCAWSLVNSRRETKHLKNKVKELKDKQDDNLKIIDLYRNAFETQLERNRKIFVAILNKQINTSQPGNLLMEGGPCSTSSSASPSSSNSNKKEEGKISNGSGQFEQDYMLNIIDMLRDRTEELFHKRLSAQFLADRIYQLESELKSMKEVQQQQEANTTISSSGERLNSLLSEPRNKNLLASFNSSHGSTSHSTSSDFASNSSIDSSLL